MTAVMEEKALWSTMPGWGIDRATWVDHDSLEAEQEAFMASNTLSRSLHDLGLSAWFGGSLANAVALNPAAKAAKDAKSAGAVVNAGWDRWTPVNAAAIGAHVAVVRQPKSHTPQNMLNRMALAALTAAALVLRCAAQ